MHSRTTLYILHTGACLEYLYILAFTSGLTHAGSDDGHEAELRAAGQTRHVALPDRPGDDYLENKGDLWKLSLTNHFQFTECIHLSDVEGIAITEHSNDGWHIESIVTLFGSGTCYQLATTDFDANRWIDGDDKPSKRRFELNLWI